ncbi:MAG: 4Fe-4S binding protein [Anaerolineales bacterium]|jgi:polyferredoxin
MIRRRRDPWKLLRLRRTVQIVFFLVLMFLLVRFLLGRGSKSGVPLIVAGIVTVVLSLSLGRVWCGWVCPVNTVLDQVHFKGAFRRGARISDRWRIVKYAALVFTAAAIILTASPAGDARAASASWPVGWVIAVLIGLGAIIALEAVADHFFCRYLCPLGGAVALLAKIAPMRRIVRSHCNDCSVCVDACPLGAVDPRRDFTNDPGECSVCFDCLVVCTSSSNGFSFSRARPSQTKDSLPEVSGGAR